MEAVALAAGLVIYNNVANLIPRFNRGWFVPLNMVVLGLVLAFALSGSLLDMASEEIWGPENPVVPAAVGLGVGLVLVTPLFLALKSERLSRYLAD